MRKEDLIYIKQLKEAIPFTGYFCRVDDGEEYKIQILGRGETAFYQQNHRGLILEVIAGHGVIFRKSIREWDDGKKVTEAERVVIIKRVSDYMILRGAGKIFVE